MEKPTFLDYILAGYNITLAIGIDFTASNRDPDLEGSLHSFNKDHNEYQKVIQSVGSILEVYDSDKQIPVLGFGAKIPGALETSHCFAINGNIFRPEVLGVQSALSVYQQVLHKIIFNGPTYFAPILRTIADICKSNPTSYMVFLLLTDGVILDLEQTITEIVKASALPLSLVIVGVGDEDFTAMKILDSDDQLLTDNNGMKAVRDIVQFVSFHEYGANSMKLAEETLREIPNQFIGYMDYANIPLTGSKEATDYFEGKKNQLSEYLHGLGYDDSKIACILSKGVPMDDIKYITRMLNMQNYANPLA